MAKTTTRPKPDKRRIAELAIDKELSCREIAALTGVGKTRIAELIREVKENPDTILFTENKDKIFEGLQAKLINLADDNLLKTMLSKRGLTDVAILQDKIQVLRGQASEVTGVQIRVILDNLPAPAIDVTPQDGNAITADNTTSSVLDICNIDNIRSIRDK